MTIPPFHLAFPVHDLAATEAFYAGLLGCKIGRRDVKWIDFDSGLSPKLRNAP